MFQSLKWNDLTEEDQKTFEVVFGEKAEYDEVAK